MASSRWRQRKSGQSVLPRAAAMLGAVDQCPGRFGGTEKLDSGPPTNIVLRYPKRSNRQKERKITTERRKWPPNLPSPEYSGCVAIRWFVLPCGRSLLTFLR